jgi:hypothetical protein
MENITSQNKAIRAHLESGKSITPLEALYSFGCWALSSRMSDLKKQGLKFKSELIEITSAGKTKKVSKYSIVK